MIVSKQERIRTELHDVARAAVDGFALQKAGHKVPRAFALSHDDDLVTAADVFVRRAMKRDDERITASNVWRKANSQPLLPVPTVTLPCTARQLY